MLGLRAREGHGHDYEHGHGHSHGHGHPHGRGAGEGALGFAAALTGLFLIAELVGGVVAGSLALLADAGHMATDVASLVLAWLALRLARRPASGRRTYGLDRLGVLAAFVNGLALFVIAGWIAVEAVERLRDPAPVLGGLMLAVAVGGLVVNLLALWVLTRSEGSSLNLRAAALHVVGDLLGSVAAIMAAGVILATGWTPIDPLLSVGVSVILLRGAWRVVAESGHILLEGAPAGFDAREVAADLCAAVPGVVRVHHVHAWSITEERPMATLEAEVAAGADVRAVRRSVKARLRERWGLGHATVEVGEAGEEGEEGG